MSIDQSASRTVSEIEQHNLLVRRRGADRARYRKFCARCNAEDSFSPHDLRRRGLRVVSKREQYFHQLSREERLLPNGKRRRLSVRTVRRKWQQLKKEGVLGLYRRRRSDRDKPRSRYADLLARAVDLKKEQPYRSEQVINRILQKEFDRQVPRSTLYRHLRRQGATRRKLGVSVEKVRCRWSRDEPGTLWVGDFEHGPLVMYQGRSIKTHLSAWIDCHSRYVVEARSASTTCSSPLIPDCGAIG